MIDVNQAKGLKELFERERTVKPYADVEDAGDRDPGRRPPIKNGRCRRLRSVVSTGHQRQAAEKLVARGWCVRCERGAGNYGCTVAPYAYRVKHPDAWVTKLKTAVRRLSQNNEVVEGRRLEGG